MTSSTKAGSMSVREFKEEDAEAAGAICYHAFKQFNESAGIPPDVDFTSVDAVVEIIRHIMTGPTNPFGIVAYDEGTGHLFGSGFLHHQSDVYYVGPISVDPAQSNRGAGTAIMKGLINRANEEKAVSIRLTQAAPNAKSFCLYLGLGFIPRECFASFRGTLRPEQAAAAATAVGFVPTTNTDVRLMGDDDVGECAELFQKTMGYDRTKDIRQSLGPTSWVLSSKSGGILAYTTGFHLFGHTVSQSEGDFVTLFNGMISGGDPEYEYLLSISTRLHPQLARWALAAKLSLASHQWYMVMGEYKAPPDGVVYFPSVGD